MNITTTICTDDGEATVSANIDINESRFPVIQNFRSSAPLSDKEDDRAVEALLEIFRRR